MCGAYFRSFFKLWYPLLPASVIGGSILGSILKQNGILSYWGRAFLTFWVLGAQLCHFGVLFGFPSGPFLPFGVHLESMGPLELVEDPRPWGIFLRRRGVFRAQNGARRSKMESTSVQMASVRPPKQTWRQTCIKMRQYRPKMVTHGL